MRKKINLVSKYVHSKDIVAREIYGDFVIIPVSSDISSGKEALFSFNKPGKAIWDKLDGTNSLKDIVAKFSKEFKVSAKIMEADVAGLTEELLKRKLIVKK